jgi:hypothetical protein
MVIVAHMKVGKSENFTAFVVDFFGSLGNICF